MAEAQPLANTSIGASAAPLSNQAKSTAACCAVVRNKLTLLSTPAPSKSDQGKAAPPYKVEKASSLSEIHFKDDFTLLVSICLFDPCLHVASTYLL